ncbi:hypothetical protein BDZ45DRAFT_630812 [Acephala macrosclerotiorum]|nr:hypothetical protein BDZ45DRAFT_630812 [Acephala macrosclerotiorum]
MASSLPIPAPPRTPTPPTPIPEEPDEGFGGNGGPQTIRTTVTFDPNALSPMRDTFPSRFGGMASPMVSSAGSTPTLSSDGRMGPPPPPGGSRGPFNFQTQAIKDSPAMANSNIGKRRGHRYKHSSVSAQHQIFLEPPPRAPLALPASLPIPTYKEAWTSRSKEQTTRIVWCACHIFVAGYVLYSAAGSLALTALSHLIFFDAISAIICVVVDILSNFEVWKRSSIRHPFGLERAEVLAGFAMSVFLIFMGFDLISHNLKHVLEGLGSHTPHHPHAHERVSPGSVDSAALLSIIATLISAIALKNHARIGKTMRFAVISSLPSVLSNPSHFLTLSCSTIMLLLPLLTITMYLWLDRLLCAVIAISMFVLGVKLATTQGLMLLMSYSGKGVSEVMREVQTDPCITHVEEARFWQVHYGLCMANLKLRVKGDEGQLNRLRERLNFLVKNRLGGGYGKGSGVKWEVTLQMTLDKS